MHDNTDKIVAPFESTQLRTERSARTAIGRFSATPRPFLKWAGSKQALLPQFADLLPDTFGDYYEPFLGSGAVFFHLKPECAHLSDFCGDLVATYQGLRDATEAVVEYLRPLRPDQEKFYEIRSSMSSNPATRAAQFIYLNKTCWNGLYRVNSSGIFNVPYGRPKSDNILDEANLRACACALQGQAVSLSIGDFEIALQRVKRGDLVFLDPPYVTKHNNNGFRDYNETLFSWKDQERLARIAHELVERGASVFITNAEHDDLVRMYEGFEFRQLVRTSTLASNAQRRGKITEALFYQVSS